METNNPAFNDFWFPASMPPEKSMKVIACLVDDYGSIINIQSVWYSTKNKAFNSFDVIDDHEYDIHPTLWKPMPERIEDLKIYDPAADV